MQTTKRWEAERQVEAAAATVGAGRWDAEPLDSFLESGGHAEAPNIGLAGLYPPAFRLHLHVFASTSTQAEERAQARLPKLPNGWRVRSTAFPPA
jgi:hypothetical protein